MTEASTLVSEQFTVRYFDMITCLSSGFQQLTFTLSIWRRRKEHRLVYDRSGLQWEPETVQSIWECVGPVVSMPLTIKSCISLVYLLMWSPDDLRDLSKSFVRLLHEAQRCVDHHVYKVIYYFLSAQHASIRRIQLSVLRILKWNRRIWRSV